MLSHTATGVIRSRATSGFSQILYAANEHHSLRPDAEYPRCFPANGEGTTCILLDCTSQHQSAENSWLVLQCHIISQARPDWSAAVIVNNAIYVNGARVASPATLEETTELSDSLKGMAWIGLYQPSHE